MNSPEQRKKWREAARAAKANKERNGTTHDAIIYLKHAERAINRDLRSGRIKKLGRAHLLTLLALGALQGE